MKWNEVTAIFGGTFDPPHLGHKQAVQGLFENPGIRRALVIPAGTPPFKPQATSNAHRFRMAELTFAGIPDVRLDDRELKRPQGVPSYTIDTLQELKREIPEIAFVAGTDQLNQLHTWHRFHDLLQASHWIILTRKPEGEEIAFRTLKEWEASGLVQTSRESSEWTSASGTRIRVVATPAQAISSSAIREEIAREADLNALTEHLRDRLAPQVLTYLMEHRIYGIHHPETQHRKD